MSSPVDGKYSDKTPLLDQAQDSDKIRSKQVSDSPNSSATHGRRRQARLNLTNRFHTDSFWTWTFIAFLLVSFSLGVYLRSSPHHKYDTDGPQKKINADYRDDMESCCKHHGNKGYDCSLVPPYIDSNSTNPNSDACIKPDTTIFEVISDYNHVPIACLIASLTASACWLLLMRNFPKVTLISSQLIKIFVLLFAGVIQRETSVGYTYYSIAALMSLLMVCRLKRLNFTNALLLEANKALSASRGITGIVVLLLICFIGISAIFIYLMLGARYFYVVKEPTKDIPQCHFDYDVYSSIFAMIIGLFIVWIHGICQQIRRCIICGAVGGFYFACATIQSLSTTSRYHSTVSATSGMHSLLKLSVSKSFGTIAVTALIGIFSSIVRHVWSLLRLLDATCPSSIFDLCCSRMYSIMPQVTPFSCAVHAILGFDFEDSTKAAVSLMRRHFVDGYVSITSARGTFAWTSYCVGIAVSSIVWLNFDNKSSCDTLRFVGDDHKNDGSGNVLLWTFVMFGCLPYPIFGAYIAVMLAAIFKEIDAFNGPQDYVIPLAAIAVGCICKSVFDFVAYLLLDGLDCMFVCFALDRETDGISDGTNLFYMLVLELPDTIKNEYSSSPTSVIIDANETNSDGRRRAGTTLMPGQVYFGNINSSNQMTAFDRRNSDTLHADTNRHVPRQRLPPSESDISQIVDVATFEPPAVLSSSPSSNAYLSKTGQSFGGMHMPKEDVDKRRVVSTAARHTEANMDPSASVYREESILHSVSIASHNAPWNSFDSMRVSDLPVYHYNFDDTSNNG